MFINGLKNNKKEMKKTYKFAMLAVAALMAMSASAQNLTIKGVLNNNRHDDGETLGSQYVGWNAEIGKAIFVVDQGIYSMTWDGNKLSTPVKDPAVNISDFYQDGKFTDNDKALWATNFNLMYGNSGAVYTDGIITTVFSRDYQSTVPEEMFAVRKWDANTGELLKTYPYFSEDKVLESAGMAYNPVDGKVYGLFYVTNAQMEEDITSDPDYFVDDDEQYEGREGLDAGYAIGTINLETMDVELITKGLYYYNFITFAINSEGRAFALTSGGTNGYIGEDGKMRNINNELTGAQVYEFDLATGVIYANATTKIDPETGEEYETWEPTLPATGYCSKYKKQAACFDKNNPSKMYWVGYFNSGKGINDYGSWGELPDKEWRTNGKYDTCLYEIDINTGEANRLAMIDDRITFSALWVDGADNSDNGVEEIKTTNNGNGNVQVYTASGQLVYNGKAQNMNLGSGLYIVKSGDETKKMLVK